ncbi:hypothetical protein RRF57_008612 [Xylaria bambusicola]|uniref:Secreted protein n=1 Tax=Xylaria bambusicola TaxID=326684 RepID=A0AAN7UTR2_9PEZI
MRWLRLLAVDVFVIDGAEQDPHPETAVETLHHQHQILLVLLQLHLGELEPALVAAPARPEVHPCFLVETEVVEIDGLDARVEARGYRVLLLCGGGCG